MPNLTSYRPPPTHVHRELPKRFCDLIRHELDYAAFLRTRIANVHGHDSEMCHNENYKQKTKISHFRLRQRRWKEKVDRENERFGCSLVYLQKQYRPMHDRAAARDAFRNHQKRLKAISQYPSYRLKNPLHEKLFTYSQLPESIHFHYSQFYQRASSGSWRSQCQTLPIAYKSKDRTAKKGSDCTSY